MKSKILFILLMLISAITYGQDQKSRVMEEIKVVPPKFTGIARVAPIVLESRFEPVLQEYMTKNIEYPQVAYNRHEEGTAVVSFVVTPNGEVEDFQIVNSVSPEIDQEVIRVLQTTSGMWMPGYNNSEAVAMEKEVSVLFRINPNNDFIHETQKIFTHGSMAMFIKEKPKRALRIYDRGIVLMPNDKSLLLVRGLTRYELGDKDGACRDWNRIKTLGGECEYYLNEFCEMKGYADMIQIIGE